MSLRILLFTDNGSFTDYLSQLLTSAGHATVTAPDGGEPHRAVRSEKPDLIIVSVDAAKVAGLTVEQRLHTGKGTRSVPVIVISERLELEAELPHVFDFIPKPLDTVRLFDALAAVEKRAVHDEPPPRLSDRQYVQFSSHILSSTGLYFESRNRSALERGIRKRMAALFSESCDDYLAYLKRHGESRHELQKLVQLLTVGETYFFRYPSHYDALRDRLLARAHLREPIRIWSAGCSTGEEPYSVAMTVMETLPDWSSRDIRIIATDINDHSLKKARDGVYNPWSIRSTERRHLERYFVQTGESYAIRDEVKRLVAFHQLNLAAQCRGDFCSELQELDAIFCRNVLIYFSAETSTAMLKRFAGVLKPSGQLFLGHAESMFQRPAELEIRRQENSFYYVRAAAHEAKVPAAAAAPPQPQPPPQLPPLPFPEREERHAAPDLDSARRLFDAEDIDGALEVVEALLARTTDDPAALILRGFVLASQGRVSEALDTCARVIALNDLLPDAYFLKGILLDACGFLAEAADEYRKALLLDNDFIMPRYYMGRLHLRLGRVSEGAREIRNSIRLLARRAEEETVPYSGGLTRSVCIEQLQNALARVA